MAETPSESLDDMAAPPPEPPQSWLRTALVWTLKIVFLGGIFWYLFSTGRLKLDDLRLLAQRWDLVLMALAMALPALMACSLRYKLLLRVLNVTARFRDIVALSMIGMFFDMVSPVANGGDLVKAVYLSKATRPPGGKSNFGIILFSVLLDRIVGLFALFIFALIVCVVAWPQISGSPELCQMTAFIVIACLCGLFGFFIMISETLENSELRKQLMHKLPFRERIERIYSGFAGFRHHKLIVLQLLGLSIINHMSSCAAILILAQGLTFMSATTHLPAPLELLPCLTVLPLGLFATTFGPAGGLGGGNVAFEFLFHTVLDRDGGAKLVLWFQICGILFRLTGVPVFIFYKNKGANLDTAPSVE
ncbi:MAG: lysylphosphatidylglycerol synthase transmembrane domain-containing protein [Planctomycetota bacterium]